MVFKISDVYQVAATASGSDKNGHAVRIDLTAYVIDAGDAGTAVSVVEAQVLNEAVIPDGTGGFTNPTRVTGNSLQSSAVLPVAPLIYTHTGSGDEKFPVSSIYEVQAVASLPSFQVSTTIDVFPLNIGLSASIALAISDVLTMPIVKNPVTHQFVNPQTVVVNSASPVPSAPWSGPVLIPTVVIPNWPDEETIDRGGGGLPSAAALGLKINIVFVPNDGTHSERDVVSLNPPAGSTVPVGSLVTVSEWGPSPG